MRLQDWLEKGVLLKNITILVARSEIEEEIEVR